MSSVGFPLHTKAGTVTLDPAVAGKANVQEALQELESAGGGGVSAILLPNHFDFVRTGVWTLPTWAPWVSLTKASGDLELTYFRVRDEMSVESITMSRGAAGSSFTLMRFGVYEYFPDDEVYELIAATPNDTSFLTAEWSWGTKAVSTPASLYPGHHYYVGPLQVADSPMNINSMPSNFESGHPPAGLVPAFRVSALADLPGTIENNRHYARTAQVQLFIGGTIPDLLVPPLPE